VKRCYGCMNLKNDTTECEICGYLDDESTDKTYYLNPGTKLSNNRYELGKVIGSGGFGITYIAYDYQRNIKVAIKEYFPKSIVVRISDKKTVQIFQENSKVNYERGLLRFQEEAEMLSNINNFDNLVKVEDYFSQNNTIYIVMEYIQGKSLKEYVKNIPNQRLSIHRTMQLFFPLMDTLENLHNQNIFHRDISLDNIIITEEEKLKLIDFGSSKNISLKKSVDNITVSYKSGYTPPEQYDGSEPGAYNDIYSLAASMYRLITGKYPPRISRENLKTDWTGKKPSDLGIVIENHIEFALIRALEPDKEKRFGTMIDFKNSLINDFITVTISDKSYGPYLSSNENVNTQETVTAYSANHDDNYNTQETTPENSLDLFISKYKTKLKIIIPILIIGLLILLISSTIYAKDYVNSKNKLLKIANIKDNDPSGAYDQYSDFLKENKFSGLKDRAREKKAKLKDQGVKEFNEKIVLLIPENYLGDFEEMYKNCVKFTNRYPFCKKHFQYAAEIKKDINHIKENNEIILNYKEKSSWFAENRKTLNQMIQYSEETTSLAREGAVILNEMLTYENNQIIEEVNFNSMDSAYINIDNYIKTNLDNCKAMLSYVKKNKQGIIDNNFFTEEEYTKYTIFIANGIIFSLNIYDFYTELLNGNFNAETYAKSKDSFSKMYKVNNDIKKTMNEKVKYIDDFENEINNKIAENKEYYNDIYEIIINIEE
jgi:serine/threonine protein kinase